MMTCPDCGADVRSPHDALCAGSVQALLSSTRHVIPVLAPLAKGWLRVGHAMLADAVLARRRRRLEELAADAAGLLEGWRAQQRRIRARRVRMYLGVKP